MTVVFQEESLWLVPAGLAIYFMLWVLRNWWREQHHRGHAYDRVIRTEFALSNGRFVDHDRLLRFPR
jgi:hypothetical protein